MDNNYLSFSGVSKVLSGVYSIYDQQRAANKHIADHHTSLAKVYATLYGEGIINELKVEQLLYHFYAIINAFDDLIDESPDDMKNGVISTSIRIFNSFFEIIHLILPAEQVNRMKDVFKFLPQLVEAPLQENSVLQEARNARKVAETLSELLLIRCQSHVLAIELADSLLGPETYSIETPITCLKALEILVKDICSKEIGVDQQQRSVNVVLHLRDTLKLADRAIIDELKKTKQILEKKVVESSNELPKRSRELLASFLQATSAKFDETLKKIDFLPFTSSDLEVC